MLQLDFHCYQVRFLPVSGFCTVLNVICVFSVLSAWLCTESLTILCQTGLADVHVEISFANEYYPCDFAFTYECGMGESSDVATGDSGGGLLLVLCLLGACTCVVGCAYNYAVLHKRGEEIVPGIGAFP